jgi:hypothetical protein
MKDHSCRYHARNFNGVTYSSFDCILNCIMQVATPRMLPLVGVRHRRRFVFAFDDGNISILGDRRLAGDFVDASEKKHDVLYSICGRSLYAMRYACPVAIRTGGKERTYEALVRGR